MDRIIRYRCPLCGRAKFDRSQQPHKCVGGYRKKLPPFEVVLNPMPGVIIRAYKCFIINRQGEYHSYYDDEITPASLNRLWALLPRCHKVAGRYLYCGK